MSSLEEAGVLSEEERFVHAFIHPERRERFLALP